jgi:phosphoesterase RecJ-like protein
LPDSNAVTAIDAPRAAELAANLIRQASNLVVITHTAPDADAIGGVLGLTLALRAIGKQVTPACSDELSPRFRVMPGWEDIVRVVSAPPDVLIALDCADRERMGQIAAAPDWQSVSILNIDHHVTNTCFGQVNWIDAEATATSEIVLSLIDQLNVALTPDIAANLLHGIVGDTLGFRTPHTTPRALECAMRLMAAGANLSEIMNHQFNRRPFALLCLWSKALAAMRIEPAAGPDRARVIWTQIARDARRACGEADWGNNGLSSFLVSAEEADVAAVIVEKDDGDIDVSLRAKRGFDVSGAALSLGGGGHPLAAGATLKEPLESAVNRVLTALKSIQRE